MARPSDGPALKTLTRGPLQWGTRARGNCRMGWCAATFVGFFVGNVRLMFLLFPGETWLWFLRKKWQDGLVTELEVTACRFGIRIYPSRITKKIRDATNSLISVADSNRLVL